MTTNIEHKFLSIRRYTLLFIYHQGILCYGYVKSVVGGICMPMETLHVGARLLFNDSASKETGKKL